MRVLYRINKIFNNKLTIAYILKKSKYNKYLQLKCDNKVNYLYNKHIIKINKDVL